MANSKARMRSDAAPTLEGEYDVFLNFRGEDTRHEFTSFLNDYLVNAKVRVFMDENEIKVGDVIGKNIRHAINNSVIYIPIFSPTYADSKWCLRELAHMVKNVSNSEGKKSILPIFFYVNPKDLKLRTPVYSDAFQKHKEECPDEVEAWRNALAVVAEIKGWKVTKDQR